MSKQGVFDKEIKIDMNQVIKTVATKESNNEYKIQLNVNLTFKQNKSELFYVDSCIISVIKINNNFDKKFLNNMVAMMYSYLCSMVAQMTTMSKLPSLDLQPLDFSEIDVKIKE